MKNAAGVDSERAWQQARVFFPTPFLMEFVRKRGFRKTHFSKLRPCVRPSVRPDADISRVGRNRLPGNGATARQNVSFFCGTRNGNIFLAAPPRRGLTRDLVAYATHAIGHKITYHNSWRYPSPWPEWGRNFDRRATTPAPYLPFRDWGEAAPREVDRQEQR